MASPKVNGYSFIMTPSPAPGVESSPLMTWGNIEGTPLLLDPASTPIIDVKGPQFKVPDTPKRDKVAMALSDKASARLRKSTKKRTQTNNLLAIASPTFKHKTLLSPAAQKFVTNNLQKSTVNSQLRASYSSPSTNKSVKPKTPQLPTPNLNSKKQPATPTSVHAQSITDNLLNI